MGEYSASMTAHIPIVDFPLSKAKHSRRTLSVQPSPPRCPSSTDSHLPTQIGTRFSTPEGHLVSFRRRRADVRRSNSRSLEMPEQTTVELGHKEIEEDYEVCLAPKELRLKAISDIYARHPFVPRPPTSSQCAYSTHITHRRKQKNSPPKYIFARDAPADTPPTSNFPVLMQRPMLSTRVQPIKLGSVGKSQEGKKKKEPAVGQTFESPYHIKFAQEHLRKNFRLKVEANTTPGRNPSGLVVRRVQYCKEGMDTESAVSIRSNVLP